MIKTQTVHSIIKAHKVQEVRAEPAATEGDNGSEKNYYIAMADDVNANSILSSHWCP